MWPHECVNLTSYLLDKGKHDSSWWNPRTLHMRGSKLVYLTLSRLLFSPNLLDVAAWLFLLTIGIDEARFFLAWFQESFIDLFCALNNFHLVSTHFQFASYHVLAHITSMHLWQRALSLFVSSGEITILVILLFEDMDLSSIILIIILKNT